MRTTTCDKLQTANKQPAKELKLFVGRMINKRSVCRDQENRSVYGWSVFVTKCVFHEKLQLTVK